MKTLSQLICLLLSLTTFGQTAELVQLEHSLRWQTESNFPNFIEVPQLEKSLMDTIALRIKQRLDCSEIHIPDHIDYRLINFFGKTKIKLPKSKVSDYDVAIASSITRGTTNFKVLWTMGVKIRQGKKIILDNEVSHELEPYSVSIRLSNQPWMDENEFMNFFLFMLEENLGLVESSPGSIELGSPEMMRQKVAELMPIGKEYKLAVAGAIMEQSNSSYQLICDSTTISDFSYKATGFFDSEFSFSGNQFFANLFANITGLETYYTLNSKEKRTGAIYTHDGLKRKVRLDWLEEAMVSTDDDVIDSRIVSPITGRYFDEDSLIAQFIYYEEITKIKDMSLNDLQFQMGDNLNELVYTIIGEFKGNKFEVVFREFDKLVLIKLEDKVNAVLSLININSDSRSAGGTKFSKNMVTMTSSQKLIGKPKMEMPTAEWYPLYTLTEVNDETAIEMGYFLLLLFFAIGNSA